MAEELEDMFTEVLAESADDADTLEVPEDDEIISNEDDSTDEIVQDDSDSEIESEDEPDAEWDDESDDEPSDDDSRFDFGKIVEQYGDELVEVTVQGEKKMIPLRDVPNRVMMHEDYTQKTQALKDAERLAGWAQQVQQGFQQDPQGMLKALADAYGVAPTPDRQEPASEQADPYEDFDPEIASVLRQKDAQLQQAMVQLQNVQQTQENLIHKEVQAEVRAEFEQAKADFPNVPPGEMLKVAAAYNMPLAEAATLLEGKRLRDEMANQATANQDAEKIVEANAKQASRKGKKQATGAGRRQHKAAPISEVSPDDFSDIGELLEMAFNSTD